MNKFNSITERVRKEYIEEYLECAKVVNYTDIIGSYGAKTVLYRDLPHTHMEGYPFASDYVTDSGETYSVEQFLALDEATRKKCNLRYYYLPNFHEIYVGTTGSGKTTGCVEPQLRAIASQKNKPNLFITDPKGELFDRNAQHLKDNGYELFIINFKDLSRSDRWNPLKEVYEKQMSSLEIGKGVEYRVGKPGPDCILVAPENEYREMYSYYDGKAFPNGTELDNYLKAQRDFLSAEISSLINQLANMFISVQNTKDASWEYGAQSLMKGLLNCMLEDAVAPNTTFTGDMMTIKTIQDYYLSLRNWVLDESSRSTLKTHPLLKDKKPETIAMMSTALDNAPNTMKSYCGVFDGAFKDWVQAHILALTTGNTVDIDAIGDKNFAIFIVTRDYEKSDFQVAGLFIDWLYRKALEKAERTRNPQPLHFLLDEFGNIPMIKDFENKISTARSRNIWFHLVVQSYKQLDHVYNPERAVIIRDNCNAQIFLGAQNRQTKEIFSEECGKRFVPTLESQLNAENNTICQVPLIPISSLDLITPGHMFIKRLYMPVVTSQFIRSYIAAQNGDYKYFNEGGGLKTCAKIFFESFSHPKYTYQRIKDVNKNDDDF